jgi:dihydrofolate reductase
MIRLIAAMDPTRGIASDKRIPWKLPGDAAYFENQTTTGLIIMGLGHVLRVLSPLHDRDNNVLRRHPGVTYGPGRKN